ncbi:glycosyltransferase [Aromatoleum evansii]|uniref:glycosyltransferase n=1 Tax=Aromatoleum evansii TaxID=59406 RepID=UPI00145C99F9|nr:glycosyltransferase [Aromatoleum evansii]NMG29128.1 glycosyltransferase [Aromatoleum evansii]
MKLETTVLVDVTGSPAGSLGSYFRALTVSLSARGKLFIYGLDDVEARPACSEVLTGLSAAEAFTRAFEAAEASCSHLLYLQAPVVLTDSMLAGLHEILAKDALFGAAIPRFADSATDLVWLLPKEGDESKALLTRRALAALPEYWIVSEFPVACCLIRSSVVANPPPLGHYEAAASVLKHLLCAIRRRTFRPVIANRVVVSVDAEGDLLFPELSQVDHAAFVETVFSRFTFPQAGGDGADYFSKSFPSKDSVAEWYAELPVHRLERSLVAAYPPVGRQRSIVIDCRGMLAHFCGTTVAQLGFLEGFQSMETDWDIHVWAQDFAIKAHRLSERFPKLNISEQPNGNHAAVIHMNQLCFSGILADLHRHGFVGGCNILDTIMWDMVLGAPAHVGRIWSLDAEYLDILFYISEFSRMQFNHRFPVADGVMESVSYLSFARSENVVDGFDGRAVENYVLVFGNNYDHKDVFPTVQRIRARFPDLAIVAIGPECGSLDGVTFLPSGGLPEEQIESLVALARAVVFPSWNEGFGLPVVKALAYGRPVIVRDLPLWQEIADHVDLPGTLMSFDDAESLGEILFSVIRGDVTRVLRQGRLVGVEPLDWKACAQRMLDAVEQRLANSDVTQWMKREKLVRMICA